MRAENTVILVVDRYCYLGLAECTMAECDTGVLRTGGVAFGGEGDCSYWSAAIVSAWSKFSSSFHVPLRGIHRCRPLSGLLRDRRCVCRSFCPLHGRDHVWPCNLSDMAAAGPHLCCAVHRMIQCVTCSFAGYVRHHQYQNWSMFCLEGTYSKCVRGKGVTFTTLLPSTVTSRITGMSAVFTSVSTRK